MTTLKVLLILFYDESAIKMLERLNYSKTTELSEDEIEYEFKGFN